MNKKMSFVIFFSIIFLVACGSKTSSIVEDALNKGKLSLADEELSKAKNHFTLAFEEGENEEAKHYLYIIEKAEQFNIQFADDEMEKAEKMLEKLKQHELYEKISFSIKENEEILHVIMKERERIDEKIVQLNQLFDPKDETSMPDELYLVKSDDILEEKYLSKEQAKVVKAFQEAATKRADKLLKIAAEEQEKAERKENEERQKKKSDLSKEDAKKVVYDYLISSYSQDALNNPNVHLDYSSETENGDYVFQLYEVVIVDPKTKEGHTATWGWYAIDPKTGYVFDPF